MQADPVVTGSIFFLQRIALLPTARVIVHLADVSGAEAEVISRQVIEANGGQVPFGFELSYQPRQIDESHEYAVSAQIEEDGRVTWITTKRYAALTLGNPIEDLQLRLDPAN